MIRPARCSTPTSSRSPTARRATPSPNARSPRWSPDSPKPSTARPHHELHPANPRLRRSTPAIAPARLLAAPVVRQSAAAERMAEVYGDLARHDRLVGQDLARRRQHRMPALDLDIINEEAARYIESLIDEHFSEMGYVLVRIGKPPKRAIIFRTN